MSGKKKQLIAPESRKEKGKVGGVVVMVGAERLPPAIGAGWTAWVAVATTAHAVATATTTTTTIAAAVATSVATAAAKTAATAHHATGVGWALATTVGTDVLHGRRATTTATRATATATTESRSLASDGLEEAWNFLVGLLEKVDQVADDTTVAAVEEGSRDTRVTSTSSTTDTVDVVVDVGWQVVVDDMLNVGNIKADKIVST